MVLLVCTHRCICVVDSCSDRSSESSPVYIKLLWQIAGGDHALMRIHAVLLLFNNYSETWITRTAEDHQKSFELWVMLCLCFSHVGTVASPFHSSVFHSLAKLSKIFVIFFSCEKKTMKLTLLHENVNTPNHRKGSLMALRAVYHFKLWLKVRDMPSKLSLLRQEP